MAQKMTFAFGECLWHPADYLRLRQHSEYLKAFRPLAQGNDVSWLKTTYHSPIASNAFTYNVISI